MTIFIHIGIPKTGTTTLQRFAAANRKRLRPLGLWYPSLREIGSIRHFGHHDIARDIGRRQKAASSRRPASSSSLNTSHRKKDETKNVLLSSEFFFQNTSRHGEKTLLELKKNLESGRCSSCCDFEKQYEYMRSSYEQSVKASRRQTGSINHFIETYRHRCEYLRVLSSISDIFPDIRVETFERSEIERRPHRIILRADRAQTFRRCRESRQISRHRSNLSNSSDFGTGWTSTTPRRTSCVNGWRRCRRPGSLLRARTWSGSARPRSLLSRRPSTTTTKTCGNLYAPHLPAPLFPPISPRDTVFQGLSAQRAVEIASWALTRKAIPGAPLPPILDRVIERLRVAVGRRT